MADFNDIVGNESIKEHLKNAISLGKVSHAYIFSGEDGMGKMLCAKAFAKTLQCETGKDEPCGKCHSCIQAESLNQPDIIYVTHEKPDIISVIEMREKLVEDMQIKPYSSRYKIYIIDDAQKMNIQAQNAILKTIEEPPLYGIIIFITNNIDMFLPTILSRCVKLDFKPVDTVKIEELLRIKYQVPEYQARISAAFAQGKPGRAVRLAQSPEFEELKGKIVKLMREVHNLEICDLMGIIKQLNELNVSKYDYLDIMTMWYRDALVFKVGNDPNPLIFKDDINDIRKTAQRSSYEGIDTIIEAIDKAKKRLKANVNPDMTMELLLLTMKEN